MATTSESCVVSEDVPPPLEDMSELLRTVGGMRDFVKPKGPIKKSTNAVSDSHSRTSSSVEDDARRIQKNAWKDTSKQENKHQAERQHTHSDTFCGFKKGFLLPKTNADKSTTKEVKSSNSKLRESTNISEPDIPFIKPKSQSSKDSQYSIPEVQQAMDASRAFLENKEWVTDDLLQKIQSNDVLAKKLTNPGFAQALNEFQANPQAAMAKYGNNPEMQAFLMEFCGLLGDHFTKLGDMQSAQTTKANSPNAADMCIRSSTSPTQMTSADEEKMQKILAKSEVREALMDANIEKLLETLRTNPDAAQRFLATCNRELRDKVKILVDNGLLQFQM
ncbi:hypothetical protein LSAT2_004218 [Lamellibrachia satsuma]|nr:hypothetical protein LSAT2_004218 [Lamellibrachia satsuma]